MRPPGRPTRRAMAAMSFEPFDTDTARELPGVTRPVDAHVLRARPHPERVELAVVIVRRAPGAMDGDVQLVRALHEVQAVDHEADLRFTRELSWCAAVDIRIRAAAAHAVHIEHADAECEVRHRLRR